MGIMPYTDEELEKLKMDIQAQGVKCVDIRRLNKDLAGLTIERMWNGKTHRHAQTVPYNIRKTTAKFMADNFKDWLRDKGL